MTKRYKDLRLGMMVTYAYSGLPYPPGVPAGSAQGTIGRRADGSPVASLDELADTFDVNDLVEVAKSTCAEYIEFCTWHANMNVLYPSEAMKKFLPGHCSRRDVIRDLIDALKGTGIGLYLYVHPNDGHDFTKEDQEKVGWNDGPPYARWNEFITAVFEELTARYRGEIAGYWVDGVGQPFGAMTQEDMVRLMARVRKINGDLEIMMNGDCGVGTWADYGSNENMRWPYGQGSKVRISQTIAPMYWADGGYAWFVPEMAFQYTVLQAAVEGHTGGGACWCASPYPGGTWETGVREFYKKLGDYVRPVEDAILNTNPGRSFPTPEKAFIYGDANRWMLWVSTESKDGLTTYVHVLRAPVSNTLELPVPADGRKFARAALCPSGRPVKLVQDEQGVRLTLSNQDRWDPLDTVIALS